jgi:hypothetical protein
VVAEQSVARTALFAVHATHSRTLGGMSVDGLLLDRRDPLVGLRNEIPDDLATLLAESHRRKRVTLLPAV